MADSTDLPTVITKPDGESTSYSGGILTAAAPTSAYTTLTQSMVVVYTSTGGTSVQTTQRVLTVTDAAQYASLETQSAQTSTVSSTASASATKSSAAATSSAAAAKSSSDLSILIPAIVAPVATILIILFVFFWWFMRKRAKKAAREEPDFVMEKRNEKFGLKDNDSTHSHSSTRNLVSKAATLPPMTQTSAPPMTQESTSNGKEVEPAVFNLFPSERKNSLSPAIGPTQTPTSPLWHSRMSSKDSHNPSSPPTHNPSGPPTVPAVAVRNFSRGPSRPSTAVKELDRGATQFPLGGPAPSGLRPATAGNDPRDRALPARGPSPNNNRPGHQGPPRYPPVRSDSPVARGTPSPVPRAGPRQPPSAFTPKDRFQQQQPRRTQPSPTTIQTYPQQVQRAPDTPTGAYNGASPISQFSPIIKENGFSPIARTLAQGPSRKEPPAAINTSTSPISIQSPDFSEENMRIARAADTSRLGYYATTKSPTTATVHQATTSAPSTTSDPPNPSPRLPPPATRDAPPSNVNIPIPPTPIEAHRLPSNPNSRRADSFVPDRRSTRSMVSKLSSDDDYVDAEIDDKSEISSLDDGERWPMEQNSHIGSQPESSRGPPGLGIMKPPPLVRTHGDDANSSNYSLGRY